MLDMRFPERDSNGYGIGDKLFLLGFLITLVGGVVSFIAFGSWKAPVRNSATEILLPYVWTIIAIGGPMWLTGWIISSKNQSKPLDYYHDEPQNQGAPFK